MYGYMFYFSTIQWKTTFVTSCLLPLAKNTTPPKKRVYSLRKELAPKGAIFPLLQKLRREAKTKLTRVAFLVSVPVNLQVEKCCKISEYLKVLMYWDTLNH